MQPAAITPSAKSPPKSPPDPGEKGKPTPVPEREPRKDPHGDPYQAQIHRFDQQGAYYHSEEPGHITTENVMQHIIIELLQETKIRGPIRSALANGGHNQPHQVILIEPVSLYTNRTISGEYIEESVPLSQQAPNSLLNLQAYYAAKLVKKGDDDGDFFLEWDTWIRVTHTDLMKFHLMSKQKADRDDKWDCENHVGKYKK